MKLSADKAHISPDGNVRQVVEVVKLTDVRRRGVTTYSTGRDAVMPTRSISTDGRVEYWYSGLTLEFT